MDIKFVTARDTKKRDCVVIHAGKVFSLSQELVGGHKNVRS
jgi:hypothetical protein